MLTSLVAAVPATYLAFELVKAMLFHSENLSMMAYIVMGVTLLAAGAAVLVPLGILFSSSRKPVPPKPMAKPGAEDDIEALDDEVEVTDGTSGSFDEQDVLADSSDFDLGDSNQDMLSRDSEIDATTENLEDFDLDEDEEEVVKPKSKKKR